MDLNLKDKNVLVTGSSRGIGLGIAQALLNEGCNVMVNSRSEFNIASLVVGNPKKLSFIQADVTTVEGLKKIKESVLSVFKNKLDVLICNVGSGASVAPGTESFEDWTKSFNINFFSTTNVVQEFRSILSPGTASILCVSSICGLEQLGAPLTYSAAKAALNSYVVGMSKVTGANGIRINAIAPGNILFEGSVWDKKMQENPLAVNEMLKKEVALNKLGSIEEISNIALFLVSEKASFITGTIVVADGGQVRSW